MTELQKIAAQLSEEAFLTEDNLTDLIWLVKEYSHYVDNSQTLQIKLEKMLDQLG